MAKKLSLALAVGMLGLFSGGVGAAPLTFVSPGSSIYQQTLNNPCIFDNSSCNNGAFPATLLPVQTDGTYTSPTYTVAQIIAIVGTTFFVGIDINQASQNVPPFTLINPLGGFAFTLDIGGTAGVDFTLNCPSSLSCDSTLVNNGNGFSDALITGFDLSSFLGSASAVFTVTYLNDTNGREQFFLISSRAPPCTPQTCPQLPEPNSIALLGVALLAGVGVVAIRRRRVQIEPTAS